MRNLRISIKKSVQTSEGNYTTAELSSEATEGDNLFQVAKNLRQILDEVLPDQPYLEIEENYVD